jgi:pimeloyl-ACP methyl ester carboxylesterase
LKLSIGAFLWLIPLAIGLIGFWLWTPDKARLDLENRYLASSLDMLEVGGTRLHVRDSGPKSAPVVILIHGTGSHLQTWDGWVDALQKDFRVVRLDLPGAGLSPPDPNSDYSDTRTLGLLASLMDQLGIEVASLVGNSLGGRIAWTFAASYPERVARLVLVSPDGYASPGFEYGKAPEIPAIMNAMKYVLPRFLLRSNLALAYSDPARLSDATLQRYYDLMLAPGGRTALLDRMAQTILLPPEPLLARITAPVLLLWGVDDQMIPIANAADYQSSLANVRLVSMPSLGHVPQEEDPQRSVAPVIEFLRKD